MRARNVLAGLTSSVWSAAVALAVVPFYLKYLGVEAYGLVGLLTTTQAVVQLLDMGLAATVSREVSRCTALRDIASCARLVHTLARIYWTTSLVIAVALFLLAPLIAEHWIRPQGLSAATIRSSIELIGVVVAARWPIGLYQGVLIGSQRLSTASLINIAAVTVSGLGSVLILGLALPSITALFAWQALAGLGQALAMKRAAWQGMETRPSGEFNFSVLKTVWRFSAGMSLIALLGVLLTQTDKLLLSRLLDLTDYGRYTLATVVAGSLYIGVNPIFNALYPRFVELIEVGDIASLRRLYHIASAFLAAIVFPLAGFLVAFSTELVTVWTGDRMLAAAIAPIVALLAAGSAVHGLMYIPHALQLAYGATHIPLRINALLVCLQVPLLIQLTLSDGARGAALAWLLLHLLYCAVGTWLTHRQFLREEGARWLLRDAGIPAAISAVATILAIATKTTVTASPAVTLALGIVFLLLTVTASLCARREVRGSIRTLWNKSKVARTAAPAARIVKD